MSADPRIEDLTRLRRLYRSRGPRDGRAGVQPDGRIGMPWRFNLAASVLDAQRVMEMGGPELDRWREGMGLKDTPASLPPSPPSPAAPRDEQCPSRGPGLSHTQDRAVNPDGACVHCGRLTRA